MNHTICVSCRYDRKNHQRRQRGRTTNQLLKLRPEKRVFLGTNFMSLSSPRVVRPYGKLRTPTPVDVHGCGNAQMCLSLFACARAWGGLTLCSTSAGLTTNKHRQPVIQVQATPRHQPIAQCRPQVHTPGLARPSAMESQECQNEK